MLGIIIIVIAAAVLLFAFLVAPAYTTKKKMAPFYGRNIAHRGLFSKDQSIPENSISSFDLACEKGYGAELDVQLTKDGRVVVFHDDTLKRMCGIDSRVDEVTFDESRGFSLSGTDQRIPLFSDVLKTVNGRGPLIVELKTGKKIFELCRKTYALLSQYDGEYCIESFDPFIVMWFRFHAPSVFRGFLSQRPREYGQSARDRITGALLGNVLFNFLARPNFIAYGIGKKPFPVRFCHGLGAVPVCWTSHGRENEEGNDVVIFEHYAPPAFFKEKK